MSAADEYRRMAEQCLRWAREAKTEDGCPGVFRPRFPASHNGALEYVAS